MSWDKSFLTDSYLLFGADYESAGCQFVTLEQTVSYRKNGAKNDFLPITRQLLLLQEFVLLYKIKIVQFCTKKVSFTFIVIRFKQRVIK